MENEAKPIVEDEAGGVEGTAWIVVGTVMCVLAYRLDLGSLHAPGPGFVAFLAGLFIIVVGLIMAFARLLSKHRQNELSSEDSPIQTVAWRRLVYTLCLLVIYAVFIEPLGFVLSTFLVMFSLFFDWQKRNWFWSFFFSVAASLISFVVFEICLRCQLPHGIFPWW